MYGTLECPMCFSEMVVYDTGCACEECGWEWVDDKRRDIMALKVVDGCIVRTGEDMTPEPYCGINDHTGAIELPFVDKEPSKETKLLPLNSVSEPAVDKSTFPFTLDDLAYWVIKRVDGSTIRFNVIGEKTFPSAPRHNSVIGNINNNNSAASYYNVRVCDHDPTNEEFPVFTTADTALWIADAAGCRRAKDDFDWVLDCGDILTLSTIRLAETVLQGDQQLVKKFRKFVVEELATPPVRILKIKWWDRHAPPLMPSVWTDMAKTLKGSVLTACQGGHGRSGTSLVCLMMALNPQYTPYHAIVHLRAMHCPRAIESKEQHEYIDEVGKALGRDANADLVGKVKSFRDEFLGFKLSSAKPYQARLLEPVIKK